MRSRILAPLALAGALIGGMAIAPSASAAPVAKPVAGVSSTCASQVNKPSVQRVAKDIAAQTKVEGFAATCTASNRIVTLTPLAAASVASYSTDAPGCTAVMSGNDMKAGVRGNWQIDTVTLKRRMTSGRVSGSRGATLWLPDYAEMRLYVNHSLAYYTTDTSPALTMTWTFTSSWYPNGTLLEMWGYMKENGVGCSTVAKA